MSGPQWKISHGGTEKVKGGERKKLAEGYKAIIVRCHKATVPFPVGTKLRCDTDESVDVVARL